MLKRSACAGVYITGAELSATPTTRESVVAMVGDPSPGVANVIDGAALARDIRSTVAARVAALRTANPRFQPHLVIIHAGSRPGSVPFVQLKVDACAEVGIKCSVIRLLGDVTVKDILDAITKLNRDRGVTGIFLQLPLGDGDSIGPEGEQAAMQAISPEKDVDGFHPYHLGRLLSRAPAPLNVPCMPSGVIKLIEKAGVPIAGTHTIILGPRSVVLGLDDLAASPLAVMLRKRGAMVTQCDSWHENMRSCLMTADIVIVAIGKPEFVHGDMLKPGCVVIDIGINYVPDSTRKTGHKLVGDVHYESVSKVASWITPVPGGIGPMTFAMLMVNTLRSAELLHAKGEERTMSSLVMRFPSRTFGFFFSCIVASVFLLRLGGLFFHHVL